MQDEHLHMNIESRGDLKKGIYNTDNKIKAQTRKKENRMYVALRPQDWKSTQLKNLHVTKNTAKPSQRKFC